VAPRTREALGFRPAPLRGSATVSWLDGDRRAARNRRAQGPLRGSAKSPEERTRDLRRCDGTSRGVAVCLCFPAIREISRGRYPRCAFRRSASLFLLEGGSLKLPFTRRDLRAAMTLALRKQRRAPRLQGENLNKLNLFHPRQSRNPCRLTALTFNVPSGWWFAKPGTRVSGAFFLCWLP
jgi:hypothetical protein